MANLSGLSIAVSNEVLSDVAPHVHKLAQGEGISPTTAAVLRGNFPFERLLSNINLSVVSGAVVPDFAPLLAGSSIDIAEVEFLGQIAAEDPNFKTATSYGSAVGEANRELSTTPAASTPGTGVQWTYADWLEAAEWVAALAAERVQDKANPGRTNAGSWALGAFISAAVCILFGFDLKSGIGPFAAILNVLKDLLREE